MEDLRQGRIYKPKTVKSDVIGDSSLSTLVNF